MAPENRYVITYEGLTDDLIGAEVTKGLNEFLGKAEGVDPIDRDSVACVWRAVVKNQPPEQQKEQIEKLQKAKAGNESELGGKVKTAAAPAAPIVSAENSLGSAPNVANAAPAKEMSAAALVEMKAEPAASQFEQVGEKKVWNGDEKSLQTMYLDQTQQQFQQLQGIGLQMSSAETQQMAQQLPAGNQQQQFYQQMPAAESQMMFQQPQQIMSAESQMFQQPVPIESQMQYQQPQTQQQQYGQYPQMQQYQQPQMQYQPMQTQFEPGNLRHRRLDPGHHDSQRKGPNVPRPYTQKQLELMMQMLKELGDRYSDDVRLNNIMKGYYEKVEKARDELVAGAGGVKEPAGGFF